MDWLINWLNTGAAAAATYESVASTLPRLSVGDDDRLLDVSELLEVLAQALVGRVVRQTADEQFRVRRVLLLHDRRRHLSEKSPPLAALSTLDEFTRRARRNRLRQQGCTDFTP